jgi:hypothetical protein
VVADDGSGSFERTNASERRKEKGLGFVHSVGLRLI